MESTEHRLAKSRLAAWLRKGIHVEIELSCRQYRRFGKRGQERYSRCHGYDKYVVKYLDGDEVEEEYERGNWVADVALLNAGKVRYVFEVLHTSRTTTTRNCFWFEIASENILQYDSEATKVTLRDLRRDGKCLDCYLCSLNFYPVLGRMWVDYAQKVCKPCFFCQSMEYRPVWQNANVEGEPGFPLACCNDCLREHFERIVVASHVPEISVEKPFARPAPLETFASPDSIVRVSPSASTNAEMETLKLKVRVLELELENLKLKMKDR